MSTSATQGGHKKTALRWHYKRLKGRGMRVRSQVRMSRKTAVSIGDCQLNIAHSYT